MGQGASGSGRRRERTEPARGCVVKVYLSVEERELLRSGAAAADLAVGAFAAKAALDAAAAGAAPAGARTELEGLARLQFELAGVRRRLDQLRAALAGEEPRGGTAPGETDPARKRCAEAAEQLTQLTRVMHRRLGEGS